MDKRPRKSKKTKSLIPKSRLKKNSDQNSTFWPIFDPSFSLLTSQLTSQHSPSKIKMFQTIFSEIEFKIRKFIRHCSIESPSYFIWFVSLFYLYGFLSFINDVSVDSFAIKASEINLSEIELFKFIPSDSNESPWLFIRISWGIVQIGTYVKFWKLIVGPLLKTIFNSVLFQYLLKWLSQKMVSAKLAACKLCS